MQNKRLERNCFTPYSIARNKAPYFVFIFCVPDKLSGPSARFVWIIRRLQEADVMKLSMTSP